MLKVQNEELARTVATLRGELEAQNKKSKAKIGELKNRLAIVAGTPRERRYRSLKRQYQSALAGLSELEGTDDWHVVRQRATWLGVEANVAKAEWKKAKKQKK